MGGGAKGVAEVSMAWDWAAEFESVAKMACGSEGERGVRDRRAFTLHNRFVDTAVSAAVRAIEECDFGFDLDADVAEASADVAEVNDDGAEANDDVAGADADVANARVTRVGNLRMSVTKDSEQAGRGRAKGGVGIKIEVHPSTSLFSEELAERNLLKGMTANESTACHVRNRPLCFITVMEREMEGLIIPSPSPPCQDVGSLSTLVVLHRGCTARVTVLTPPAEGGVGAAPPADVSEMEDQAEGGAHAINPNRYILRSNTTTFASSFVFGVFLTLQPPHPPPSSLRTLLHSADETSPPGVSAGEVQGRVSAEEYARLKEGGCGLHMKVG